MIKEELRLFFTAIMFFSRIPIPKWVGYSDKQLNESTRYFPLVGALIGGIGAGGFVVFNFVFPVSISIILSMILTILVTGAFHEDGFADFCDGYGGGYTKERILSIMKDSRLGTYGTIGLLSVLVLKYAFLSNIHVVNIPFVFIAAHTLSRLNPVLLIYFSQYVRTDDSSKSKPVGNAISFKSLFVTLLIISFALFIIHINVFVIYMLSSAILFVLFRAYIHKKTGGFTGDVLGALQQLSEIAFYAVYLAVQNSL